jgi:hypothetical protein
MTPVLIVSLAITTTLLITPYTWPYDQLLLILPMFAIFLEMNKRKYPFLLKSILFIVVDIIAFIILIISARIQLEIINVFIPLIIFCALLICIIPMKKVTSNVYVKEFIP